MGMEDQINSLLSGESSDASETLEDGSGTPDETGQETGPEGEQESQESSEEQESEEVSGTDEAPEETEEIESEEGAEPSEESESSESEIERLRAEVDRLSAMISQSKGSESSDSEASESPQVSPISSEEIFDENFDFDSVMESEDNFKSFLQNFATKLQSKAHQDILQSLPDTVANYVSQQVSYQNQVRDFYSENPDLAGTKKYVAVTANQVASEHPDWELSDVLEETAKRARKSLGLHKQAKEKASENPSQKKSPALAKGTQGHSSKKKPKQELSAMEQEILSLMEE